MVELDPRGLGSARGGIVTDLVHSRGMNKPSYIQMNSKRGVGALS